MAKILIATKIVDEHAMIVECALTLKGHKTVRWYGSDFPAIQTASSTISNDFGLKTHIRGPQIDMDNFDLKSIWYRRPIRPVTPSKWLHKDDVPAAEKEILAFWNSFPYLFGSKATWVNNFNSRRSVDNKIVQLKVARQVGFKIPKSLFGNNPDDIRNFVRSQKHGAIYKAFYPMRWMEFQSLCGSQRSQLSFSNSSRSRSWNPKIVA